MIMHRLNTMMCWFVCWIVSVRNDNVLPGLGKERAEKFIRVRARKAETDDQRFTVGASCVPLFWGNRWALRRPRSLANLRVGRACQYSSRNLWEVSHVLAEPLLRVSAGSEGKRLHVGTSCACAGTRWKPFLGAEAEPRFCVCWRRAEPRGARSAHRDTSQSGGIAQLAHPPNCGGWARAQHRRAQA
jgi:hypothetical protein